MHKLLVNAPSGDQQVIEVREGGGYFDPARVLWDERLDGPLPEITLGGMVRDGDSLVVDSDLLASTTAAILAQQKAQAVSRIDSDADEIYNAVIGNRATEYAQAEADALAYRAAGDSGAVPSSVASWATAKGWTATQATDNILATATAWRTAQAAIRAARLLRKEQVRSAGAGSGIDTAMASWAGFVAAIKGQLGI